MHKNTNNTSLATLDKALDFSSLLYNILLEILEYSRCFNLPINNFNQVKPDVKRLFLNFFLVNICKGLEQSEAPTRTLAVNEESVDRVINSVEEFPNDVILNWTREALRDLPKYLPVAVVYLSDKQTNGEREEALMRAEATLYKIDKTSYSAKKLKQFAAKNGLTFICNTFTNSPQFFNTLLRCA